MLDQKEMEMSPDHTPGTFIAAEPQETYTWQLHPQYDGNGALEYQY